MATNSGEACEVGQRLRVEVEKVAHGGHFIARHAGRVFFVRHAVPGELVDIEITSVGSSFLRADAIEIIRRSDDRIAPACQYSGANGCGGCDFQHISISRQRLLKADVVREQFERIAKMDIEVVVEDVGEPLHWRTRISSATNEKGEIGFYASRSHRVIPVADCLVSADAVKFASLSSRSWPPKSRIDIAVSSSGARTVAIAPAIRGSKARITEGEKILIEDISGMQLEVSHDSFWQSHDRAPEILSGIVKSHVELGDHVLDLYGGVGLFTAAILEEVGASGKVDLVESSPSACSDARRNFAAFENVHVHQGDVEREISKFDKADVVVLDPPREGAGKNVVVLAVALNPRSIVYVACDPAALARDCRYLSDLGYEMTSLRAFDLFPMTHHIECVAVFEASQTSESNVS